MSGYTRTTQATAADASSGAALLAGSIIARWATSSLPHGRSAPRGVGGARAAADGAGGIGRGRCRAGDVGRPRRLGPRAGGARATTAAMRSWSRAACAKRSSTWSSCLAATAAKLPADAAEAHRAFIDGGGTTLPDIPARWRGSLIVDGLFGIGLARPLSAQYAAQVEYANASGIPHSRARCSERNRRRHRRRARLGHPRGGDSDLHCAEARTADGRWCSIAAGPFRCIRSDSSPRRSRPPRAIGSTGNRSPPIDPPSSCADAQRAQGKLRHARDRRRRGRHGRRAAARRAAPRCMRARARSGSDSPPRVRRPSTGASRSSCCAPPIEVAARRSERDRLRAGTGRFAGGERAVGASDREKRSACSRCRCAQCDRGGSRACRGASPNAAPPRSRRRIPPRPLGCSARRPPPFRRTGSPPRRRSPANCARTWSSKAPAASSPIRTGRGTSMPAATPASRVPARGDVLAGLCRSIPRPGDRRQERRLRLAVCLHGAAADACVADGRWPVGTHRERARAAPRGPCSIRAERTPLGHEYRRAGRARAIRALDAPLPHP